MQKNNEDLPKAYQAQTVENKIYQKWQDSGFFNPDNLPVTKTQTEAESFVISMPPPNVTGVLHVGHASMLAYQDLMIRFHRLLQKRVLWLPGTDHAAIATQTKVEKIIAQEGLDKYQMGRDKFIAKVEQYISDSQNTIKQQTKKIGASCDWSRERYTLDNGLSAVVRGVFGLMYEDGLIYRGNRIVNWCPRCESTLADDEVEHSTDKGIVYFFKYQKDFPITIATTRPETKLGDVAVAVNPQDERYQEFVGKVYKINLGNGERDIRIITDDGVDMNFGTGALGVTPAHSVVDFQMAQDYDLPIVKIINEEGRMMATAGDLYKGLTTLEARQKIVQYFREQGLMEKEEEVEQNLSVCYRCGTLIEPLTSLQWFIDVNKKITKHNNVYFQNKSLKEVMLEVVHKQEIQIIPERFVKTYFNWVENLRDWCISRQLWFGHRIPIWYCEDCGKYFFSQHKIVESCKHCSSAKVYQDADTLDTWFSSGAWTFSTLMDKDEVDCDDFFQWVANSKDLKQFHPTSVMETGYDIIFFWVARMILMTTYVLGEVPFKTVYLHGMIRDKEGRKMSKSLGNGIDPIAIIDQYGADALRLSLIIGSTPGNDLKIYEEKIANYRNFVNKLWNISRYILTKVQTVKVVNNRPECETLADQWILQELDIVINKTEKNLKEFQFSVAGEGLYDFIWNKFADWYLEISKIESDKDEILLYVLARILIILHPFAPFVTEEIWSYLNNDSLLMIEQWPSVSDLKVDNSIIDDFAIIQSVVVAVRNLRSEYKIAPNKLVDLFMFTENRSSLILQNEQLLMRMVRANSLQLMAAKITKNGCATAILKDIEVYLSLEGVVDVQKERDSLLKEREKLQQWIQNSEKKLSNKGFVSQAPAVVLERENLLLKENSDKLAKIEEKLRCMCE